MCNSFLVIIFIIRACTPKCRRFDTQAWVPPGHEEFPRYPTTYNQKHLQYLDTYLPLIYRVKKKGRKNESLPETGHALDSIYCFPIGPVWVDGVIVRAIRPADLRIPLPRISGTTHVKCALSHWRCGPLCLSMPSGQSHWKKPGMN